jgi:ABC-2 type transport system permease protein
MKKGVKGEKTAVGKGSLDEKPPIGVRASGEKGTRGVRASEILMPSMDKNLYRIGSEGDIMSHREGDLGRGVRASIKITHLGVRALKMLKDLCQICLDEFRRILSDKGVLIFFVGAQIIYPLVYPIPLYHQLVRELPVAVVDMDNSSLSRQLTRMIDASECIHISERVQSLEEAKDDFFANRVRGIVMVPKDFSMKVLRGERTAVAVYTDASYFLIYKQVYTGAAQAIGTMSAGIELKKLTSKGNSYRQAVALRDPAPVVSVPLYNENGAYGSYLVPAVLIIILQQTLLIGIGMLGGTAAERRTPHFMLSSFTRRRHIAKEIFGKSLTYLVLYSVYLVYFFGVLFRFYHYPQRGEIFSLVGFFIPFLLAVIYLAMTFSTFFRSRESSIIFLLCASVPCILFSGFSWPSISMPDWLRLTARMIQSTSGIDGLLKLELMGGRFSDIFDDWMILWGIAAFYFLTAIFAVKRVIRMNPGSEHRRENS